LSPGPRASPTPNKPPVIIASPTASATPVTHVVKAGETLLGIAIQYGVSLDALQAANPNVEARFLSVGTVLIIPPPEGGFAVAATNLAPPPPANVQMSQAACQTLATGGWYCWVEAHNPNEQAIENVSARIILAGSDGLPFASQTAFGALDVVPPKAGVPLAALFAAVPTETVAATEADLLSANIVPDSGASGGTVMLEVSAQPAQFVAGEWRVQGQARNPTTQPLGTAAVLLTLYDAQGQVIGFRKMELASGLAAGEVRAFTLGAMALAGATDHDSVMGEGRP
jgi:LysM repeat protein